MTVCFLDICRFCSLAFLLPPKSSFGPGRRLATGCHGMPHHSIHRTETRSPKQNKRRHASINREVARPANAVTCGERRWDGVRAWQWLGLVPSAQSARLHSLSAASRSHKRNIKFRGCMLCKDWRAWGEQSMHESRQEYSKVWMQHACCHTLNTSRVEEPPAA